MKLTSITKQEFETLLPYQPKNEVEVLEHQIKVNIFNSEGDLILVKLIGIICDITTYYTAKEV